MASKIISELITKWVYRVDTRQVKAAILSLQKFRKELIAVSVSSAVTKNAAHVDRLGDEWRQAARGVRKYREELNRIRPPRRGRGSLGPGGGGGGGGFGASGFGGGAGASLGTALGKGGKSAFPMVLRSMGGFLAGYAAIAGVGSLTRIFGAGIERESNRRVIENFAPGKTVAERTAVASDFIAALEDFAIATKFKLNDLQRFAGMMLASGTALEDVIPRLDAIGKHISLFPNINKNMAMIILNALEHETVGKLDRKQENEFNRRFFNVTKTAASILFPFMSPEKASQKFAEARSKKDGNFLFTPALYWQAAFMQAGTLKAPPGVTVAKDVSGNLLLSMLGAPGAVAELGDKAALTATKMAEQLNPAIERFSDLLNKFITDNEEGLLKWAAGENEKFKLWITRLSEFVNIIGNLSAIVDKIINNWIEFYKPDEVKNLSPVAQSIRDYNTQITQGTSFNRLLLAILNSDWLNSSHESRGTYSLSDWYRRDERENERRRFERWLNRNQSTYELGTDRLEGVNQSFEGASVTINQDIVIALAEGESAQDVLTSISADNSDFISRWAAPMYHS